MLGVAWMLTLGGCGNADERVLRFVAFDGAGSTQADAVRPSSADVDVPFPSICVTGTGEDQVETVEPFTQTAINAVLVNEQAADIELREIHIDAGPFSGLGIVQETVSATIPGGRCSDGARCAVAGDCFGSSAAAGCAHTPTTISGILLFDFAFKAGVNPEIYGQATNITVTFVATDETGASFVTEAGYVATFANFNNCDVTN
jgi:hypothetical protein